MDSSRSGLPARSVMADLSNVMRGVASDESGGVGSSAISSTLYADDGIAPYAKCIDDDPSSFFPPPTVNGMAADYPTNISGNILSIPSGRTSFQTDSVLNITIGCGRKCL